jgi:hypothetical protein
MPHLAFCANCGSERLDVVGVTQGGIEVRCYVCTKTSTVSGVILGEVDFLAGAKTKVEAMVARSREHAALKARKAFGASRG